MTDTATAHEAKDFTFNIVEPNSEYLHHYISYVKNQPNLILGIRQRLCIEALVPFYLNAGEIPISPFPEAQDLVLGIHMLYFVEDLDQAVATMVTSLKPGGKAFLVYAKEDPVGT